MGGGDNSKCFQGTKRNGPGRKCDESRMLAAAATQVALPDVGGEFFFLLPMVSTDLFDH